MSALDDLLRNRAIMAGESRQIEGSASAALKPKGTGNRTEKTQDTKVSRAPIPRYAGVDSLEPVSQSPPPEPGIYDISEDAYHADPCQAPSLSASIAKILIAQTPLHAWTAHPKLNPNFVRIEKEIFDLGTVAHALMLQGIAVGTVCDFPDWRTKEARAARELAYAEKRIPILAKHWSRIQSMVLAGKECIAANKDASDLFTDAGKPEVSMVWIDADSGVQCRARMDWLRGDHRRIADFKTTGTSASPEGLMKFATSQGWDIQAAMYLRGLKAVTGQEDVDFFFVVQEDYEPYALSVVALTEESLMTGEKKVQYAIDLFARCLRTGRWPAYSNRVCAVPFDTWDAERWAAKEAR